MRVVLALALSLLLSGCASPSPEAEPTPSPTGPQPLPPRVLFAEEGNPDPCTEVLREDREFPFTVSEGYDQVEIVFHVSGVGRAGWALYGPDGALLQEREYDRQTQPCTHPDHGALQGEIIASKPGSHRLVVSNLGIVSWHLAVSEKSANATDAAPHHH